MLEEWQCFNRFYCYFLRPTDSAIEMMACYSFQEVGARLHMGVGGAQEMHQDQSGGRGAEKKTWARDFVVVSRKVKQVSQGRQV